VSSDIHNITFDCADPHAVARFWGGVTGRPVIDVEVPEPGSPECSVGRPGPHRPRLYFVRVPEGKTVKNRVHLDVMPNDRTQQEELDRLVALGGRIVHDARPEIGWVVMADVEGNEFCVELSRGEIAELEAAEAAEAAQAAEAVAAAES
jgi:hypothetical protein